MEIATCRHRGYDREPNRIHRAPTIELICRVTKKAPAQSKRDPIAPSGNECREFDRG
jgi:hypothetical protein